MSIALHFQGVKTPCSLRDLRPCSLRRRWLTDNPCSLRPLRFADVVFKCRENQTLLSLETGVRCAHEASCCGCVGFAGDCAAGLRSAGWGARRVLWPCFRGARWVCRLRVQDGFRLSRRDRQPGSAGGSGPAKGHRRRCGGARALWRKLSATTAVCIAVWGDGVLRGFRVRCSGALYS
jgi:hypothetical protein